MDLKFFGDTWEVYERGLLSREREIDFQALLFQELARISPGDLISAHLLWMQRCEKYYAAVEDYERANLLKNLQQAAGNVFQARENLEQIRRKYN